MTWKHGVTPSKWIGNHGKPCAISGSWTGSRCLLSNGPNSARHGLPPEILGSRIKSSGRAPARQIARIESLTEMQDHGVGTVAGPFLLAD